MDRSPDIWDVIILGAGAAGLAAANELSQKGLRSLVVEARDRTGGRIHTYHDPGLSLPVELGAEFIHGTPEELWKIAQAAKLAVHDVTDLHWYSLPLPAPGEAEAGGTELVLMPHFWEDLKIVLGKMRSGGERDQSFARFLTQAERDREIRRFLPIVRSYVEGFHGADPRHMSERALATAEDELSDPKARRIFRLSHGYDQIIHWLAAGAVRGGAEIRLNTVVHEVKWKVGQVELKVGSRAGFDLPAVHGRKLIITLPLSLLQASIHENPIEGAVRFLPSIKDQRARASDRLRMGPVMKIILRFRSRFWEEHPTDAKLIHQDFFQFSFLHHAPKPDVAFPTWWSQLPFRAPILTGWTGGPKALELADRSEEAIVDEALRSLAIATGFSRSLIESELQSWHYHDWQADPYARGAYSYIGVDGLHAQRELARAIQDTLFFAGEATHFGGQSGTVDGAIATGIRAAREILQVSSTRARAA